MPKVADRLAGVGGSSSVLVAPRLLSVQQAAVYLGCSDWTVNDYVLSGRLPVVTLPPVRPRDGDRPQSSLRRTLIDRADLDAFIEQCKAGSHGRAE